jgi:apolipoprotein D and lipocalin family protein
MARTPTLAAADLERLTAFVATQGYDPALLRRMPQGGAR